MKIAFRNFFKNKSYFFINILGLTTGLTAYILITLYVNFETSWDSFHEHGDRVYRVEPIMHFTDLEQYWSQTPGPLSGTLKDKYPEIEDALCLRETWGEYLNVQGEEPFFEKNGYHTENSIFNFFDFKFVEGSPENALVEPNTIVITEKLAQKYFPNESALGKVLIGEGVHSYKITGVIENPRDNFHLRGSYYISMSSFKNNLNWDMMNDWYSFSSKSYIKLKNNNNLNELKRKIKSELNNYNENVETSLVLVNIEDMHLESGNDRGMLIVVYMLTGTSILILLLAGINFMNLTTAFSSSRYKEIGLRKVMGSTRPKIIRQFIGESLSITIISLLLALGLAELLLPTFGAIVNTNLVLDYQADWQFIVSLVAVAVALGVLSSLLPSLRMSAFSPINALRGMKSKQIGRRKFSMKKVLIVFQIHISIVFVLMTIENYRQFQYYDNKDLGFERENLVICEVNANKNVKVNDWRILRNDLLSNPAIVNAAISYTAPYNGSDGRFMNYEGGDLNDVLSFRFNRVGAHFIEAYGMEIVEGRNFHAEPNSDTVACIVNETAVKVMGYENPIGMRLRNNKYKIIGVVKDFHETTPYMKIEPYLMIKKSNKLDEFKRINIKVAPGELTNGMSFIKAKLREYFPHQLYKLDTFAGSASTDEAYKVYKSMSQIFIFFSVIAIIIAVVGLFAIVSYAAKNRVKEIGIRKVLGASSALIYRYMAKEYFILLIIAMFISLGINFFTEDLNPSFYKPERNYFLFLYTFIGAALIITLTISSQIIRTSRTNPVKSLKYE